VAAIYTTTTTAITTGATTTANALTAPAPAAGLPLPPDLEPLPKYLVSAGYASIREGVTPAGQQRPFSLFYNYFF
jgi:hypothetical protein